MNSNTQPVTSNNYISIEIVQDSVSMSQCSFCNREGSGRHPIQDMMCPCGCVLPVHIQCLQRTVSGSTVKAVCPKCHISWLHAMTIPLLPSRRVEQPSCQPWRICCELALLVVGLCAVSIIVWITVKYNVD